MLKDLAQGDAERYSEVSAMLKEFDEAHAHMSRELKAVLATAEAERRTEVWGVAAPPKAGLATAEAERRTEVWGAADPPNVEVAPLPLVEELPEEEAVARAEPVEVTPEATAGRDQIFEYLANHPDGMRMVELEEEFGLSRIQMARILKSLTDDNKVEKRDMIYFAI